MSASYEYYKIFYYVAKYKSFNKAASVLSNSQPNISRTITNLEYELGCKLFDRSPRGVKLTDAGKELYSHVKKACEHLEMGESVVRSVKDLRHGTLVIGLSIGISNHITSKLILPSIKQFRKEFPEVDLYLINHHTPKLIQNYKEGLIDIAIITTPYSEKKEFDKIILHSYQDILIAGPDYYFLKDKTLSLKEVMEYPLISLLRSTETYYFYNNFCAEHGLEFRPMIEAVNTTQMLSYVSENLGIGCSDITACKDDIEQNRMIRVNLKEKMPMRYIALAGSKKKVKSPAALRFIDMLTGNSSSI